MILPNLKRGRRKARCERHPSERAKTRPQQRPKNSESTNCTQYAAKASSVYARVGRRNSKRRTFPSSNDTSSSSNPRQTSIQTASTARSNIGRIGYKSSRNSNSSCWTNLTHSHDPMTTPPTKAHPRHHVPAHPPGPVCLPRRTVEQQPKATNNCLGLTTVGLTPLILTRMGRTPLILTRMGQTPLRLTKRNSRRHCHTNRAGTHHPSRIL